MRFLLKYKSRIILLLILILILVKGFYSEKLVLNQGLGWDGYHYADFTENMIEHLQTRYFNKYDFQRIAVPLLMHFVFSVFDIAYSTLNIVRAYCLFNIFCILLGAAFFFGISRKLNLSKSEEIIGFSSLFFCFPVLKFSQFYAPLMDIPALTAGIIFVYYYIKRNITGCMLTILVGSFIFPNFIVLGTLLFFKRREISLLPENSEKAAGFSWKRIINDKINLPYLLICFGMPLLLTYTFFTLYYNGWMETIIQDLQFYTPKTLFKWLCFALAIAYLLILNKFPKRIFSFSKLFGSVDVIGILGVLGIFLLVRVLIFYYSSNQDSALTLEIYLLNVTKQAIQNPLNFLIAHVFYFGLTPLLLLLLLKDVKQIILSYGYGMLSFFTVFIFFSVGNESRQLLNFYPLLVLLVLVSLNKYWQVSLVFSLLYAAVCLGLSHFWFSINNEFTASARIDTESTYFHFPWQRYFMFHGPWVSDFMYTIHLAIGLFFFILLFVAFRKTPFFTRKTITA